MDLDEHARTIVHIDADCFYAQVEINKNESLREHPLGVQQKNIVVTSNYEARKFGVGKCMLVDEARRLCPTLVLVNGEDLHDYRKVSYQITTHLQSLHNGVERLGLDENYVDVSAEVNRRISSRTSSYEFEDTQEIEYSDDGDRCQCGCYERIRMGAVIAGELRRSLYEKFRITTCAGIAHNKLLAKIVGAQNKPNKQTLLYPSQAPALLLLLKDVAKLPGIGVSTAEKLLSSLGISNIADLQNVSNALLVREFGAERAQKIHQWAWGIDPSPVKTSGKPLTIGLEDSCPSVITMESEVRAKLDQLLARLIVLLDEDGRIPRTIKLTVRKLNSATKVSHRETKQCPINGALFRTKATRQKDILNVLMQLFARLMMISSGSASRQSGFQITLLGLAFAKFQSESCKAGSGSAALLRTFLTNRKSLEVQTVTSISSSNANSSYSDQSETQAMSVDSPQCDSAESDYETTHPSPKKLRLALAGAKLMAKRRCPMQLVADDAADCPSPSKLRVSELRLSSRDSDSSDSLPSVCSTSNNMNVVVEDSNRNFVTATRCPPMVDAQVFEQLPPDVQKELWDDYQLQKERDHQTHLQRSSHSVVTKKSKVNSILNYLVKNS